MDSTDANYYQMRYLAAEPETEETAEAEARMMLAARKRRREQIFLENLRRVEKMKRKALPTSHQIRLEARHGVMV